MHDEGAEPGFQHAQVVGGHVGIEGAEPLHVAGEVGPREGPAGGERFGIQGDAHDHPVKLRPPIGGCFEGDRDPVVAVVVVLARHDRSVARFRMGSNANHGTRTIVLYTIARRGYVDPMSRQKEADRTSVTSRGGPSIMVRLTEAEFAALQFMINEQQATVDEHGIVTRVSAASVIRSLIRSAAQVRGLAPFAPNARTAKAAKPKPRKTKGNP